MLDEIREVSRVQRRTCTLRLPWRRLLLTTLLCKNHEHLDLAGGLIAPEVAPSSPGIINVSCLLSLSSHWGGFRSYQHPGDLLDLAAALTSEPSSDRRVCRVDLTDGSTFLDR